MQYAQHDKVVHYSWGALRAHWSKSEQRFLGQVADSATRPLAFSARGTHATYPFPCSACSQTTKHWWSRFHESGANGGLEWSGNNTSVCGDAPCLKLLPTRDQGRNPALWADYDGPWGEWHCWRSYYCNAGEPPPGPGHQTRFEHPERYTDSR